MPAPILPLKRKLESALLSYLKAASGLTVAAEEGDSGWFFCHGAFAGRRLLPRIVVHVESAEPAFPGALPNWCGVAVYVFTAIDAQQTGDEEDAGEQDGSRAAAEALHDEAVAILEAAMQDGAALAAHVNKVNLVDRPVSDFFLYEAVEAGQQTDIENRQFGNALRYRVLCEAQDN